MNRKQKDREEHVHFRRCHVCGHVNELPGAVIHSCGSCGKSLQPLLFYNEARRLGIEAKGDATAEERMQSEQSEQYRFTALPLKEYPPLFGVVAYW